MPAVPCRLWILNKVVRECLPELIFEERFGRERGDRNTYI